DELINYQFKVDVKDHNTEVIEMAKFDNAVFLDANSNYIKNRINKCQTINASNWFPCTSQHFLKAHKRFQFFISSTCYNILIGNIYKFKKFRYIIQL
ncbi:hypothetical protein ACJX0J_006421, partial [Zea mays]